MKVVYLAAPYTHRSPDIRQARVDTASRAAAKLMEHGLVVFSPITHGHNIHPFLHRAGDHDWWMGQCLPILSRCDAVIVLTNEGWVESAGVAEEILTARQCRIPVFYADPFRPLEFKTYGQLSQSDTKPEECHISTIDWLRTRFPNSR